MLSPRLDLPCAKATGARYECNASEVVPNKATCYCHQYTIIESKIPIERSLVCPSGQAAISVIGTSFYLQFWLNQSLGHWHQTGCRASFLLVPSVDFFC